MSSFPRINIPKVLEAQAKYNMFTCVRPVAMHIENPHSLLNMKLCAIKDNICGIPEPTTCGSKMLKNYRSPFKATVLDMLENYGTVIVGKTNMDEFGMGSTNTNSAFGPVYNPSFDKTQKKLSKYTLSELQDNEETYDFPKHIAGGSSGGSAAAVASNVVDFALGTDTGGSVRLPASYCGVVGFKPTYGRLSRWGVIQYAQSFDTVGILARDVDTSKLVFDYLNEFDEKDPTSLLPPLRKRIDELAESRNKGLQKLRIGIPKQLNLDVDSKVRESWIKLISQLFEQDHDIYPVDLPSIEHSIPSYYTLVPSEAASNLARYDGIRYGYRSESDSKDDVLFAPTRDQGFGEEVKRRVLIGNFNLSHEAYISHYLKAQNLRHQIKLDFDKVFRFPNVLTSSQPTSEGMDILIAPTSLSTAPTVEEANSMTPLEVFVNDALTVPSSLAGLPTCSIPMKTPEPIGMQVIGQFGDDNLVLNASRLIQQSM
ncbi:BA75_02781T0 [Komagataella pastoris]|uniref:Glutamyl-tRNA(Gln) amidotransferase subunit A, mitochondrial n=1 Tax=Komagataella pastoris TaxID=4922 RepID=A0A1B2JAI7_PICPA|nr:BA75_02781T0 [Komagataella pastoris]